MSGYRRILHLAGPLDLARTLWPLYRGPADPTFQLGPRHAERATTTPAGPGAISIIRDGDTITAEAWGPGAEWLLETLPGFLGLDDDAAGFDPTLHPVVADLARRRPGGPPARGPRAEGHRR